MAKNRNKRVSGFGKFKGGKPFEIEPGLSETGPEAGRDSEWKSIGMKRRMYGWIVIIVLILLLYPVYRCPENNADRIKTCGFQPFPVPLIILINLIILSALLDYLFLPKVIIVAILTKWIHNRYLSHIENQDYIKISGTRYYISLIVICGILLVILGLISLLA